MFPTPRIAGIAGIVAGIGLAIEFALFMTSGWTPAAFADPAAAMAFMQTSGAQLRTAVFAGFLNLAFATIFIAGLAGRLYVASPSRASATLYFGLLGIAAHGLVPVSLWLGIPMLLGTATQSPQAAANAWGGFALFLSGAGGLGYFFAGLSQLAAGWAIVSTKSMPAVLGWVGVVAGLASATTMAAAQTPLAALARAAFLPALLLAIVFRIWAGYALWKSERQP